MNTPVQHPQRPGFGFARRNGATLTGWRDNVAEIAYRDGVKAEVLAELRRYFGAPLNLTRHDAAAFERLLRSLYEQGDDARAMVADLDGDFDLKALADDLPEPEDLAESEDDAPIIRLINALLTEAVKERLPIFTSSRSKKNSSCASASTASSTTSSASPEGPRRDRLAHQGHGHARHRRKTPAPGRTHQDQDRRQGHRHSSFDGADQLRREMRHAYSRANTGSSNRDLGIAPAASCSKNSSSASTASSW